LILYNYEKEIPMLKQYLKQSHKLLLLVAVLSSFQIKAQSTTVEIDPSCQRFINGISELDRTKFFSVHDSALDADGIAFRNDYNVTGGRDFWGPYGVAYQQSSPIPEERVPGVYPADLPGNDNVRTIRDGFVMTSHRFWTFKDGLDINAAANWAAEYFKDYINDGEAHEFFEVMNEPFVHAQDYGDNVQDIKRQMSLLFNEVGLRFENTPALANMKVIGYSAAWPSYELFDFGQWNDNQKLFMDLAGENMDAFATHLYDGINVTGQDTKRSGSNSEAILDLIENYSYIKWRKVKPHAITEYGAIESGYGPDYSEIASSQTMTSMNHILMGLLDREDRIAVSIPFATGKATWHITAENNYQPYTPALWIPTNIGEPVPAGWRYSPRILFYDLWKDVKGERALIKSDNPDIQVQAFIDNTKMHVVLSNLDDDTQTVNLRMLSNLENVENVLVKSLKVFPQAMPDFSTETLNAVPSSITLIKDETVVLEYNLSTSPVYSNALRFTSYYPTDYLRPIAANTPLLYGFTGVATGDGFASIRMSIGRKHNVSKKPIVTVNGQTIAVPDNWQGYDQANRDDFFGMIEIPFSANLLRANNEIRVVFPDDGGRVSSLILSTQLFDTPRSALSILGTGNPCPNQNSGKITIKPLLPDTYEAILTGNGVNLTETFSSLFNFENLATGTYMVVVNSTTNPNVSFEYSIEIGQPEDLSVYSRVDQSSRTISLDLSGGESYRIELNGVISATNQSQITLNLIAGENNLKVTTNKECQGEFHRKIILYDNVTIFPSLVENSFTIAFPDIETKSITGQIVLQNTLDTTNKKVTVNVEGLTAGLYFINVQSNTANFQSKIIKK